MSYRQNMLKKSKININKILRDVLKAVYQFERYKEKYFGITYELYYALTLIDDTKKITISEIAEALCIPLHKATRIIQRLHARQLVKRTISLHDKRVVYVSLTKKGMKCLKTIEDFCYSIVMNNAASLSKDELSIFIHVASAIPDILKISHSAFSEVKYAK
ncbi:MAG: MarR family transcriptional regulator [Spirochaetes bacterium]|nr:MarR family transcriptional regulator [Spirochaetota bacterium]